MTAPTPEPTPVAPPIWYPAQRVIRTVLVNVVALVPILNLSLPLVAAAFDAPDVPIEVYLTVNSVILGALAVTGILSRLIAIPAINTWLTKLGAGSVPKSALTP